MCVELDALSVPVLQALAKNALEKRLDMDAFRKVLEQDKVERQRLITTLSA
jgi:hypothetical protein